MKAEVDVGNELPAGRPTYRRLRWTFGIFAWLALGANLSVWLLLRWGDDWGPATFVMFGPRWVIAVPPTLLLVPASWSKRRALWPALAALVVALGPVMGFHVPWGRLRTAPVEESRLRVVSCNLHYGRTNPALLDQLVTDSQPDVIALQEADRLAGYRTLNSKEWHINRMSGFFLASRFPIKQVKTMGGKSAGEQGSAVRYDLETPNGNVTVISLHLASPREELKNAALGGLDELEANSDLRKRQSEFLSGQAGETSGALLLLGDFNTPAESALFRQYWDHYSDAFGEAGWGWGYTFTNRWTQVRIDHILIGGGGRAASSWVGPDLGSPHQPVIADVVWPQMDPPVPGPAPKIR